MAGQRDLFFCQYLNIFKIYYTVSSQNSGVKIEELIQSIPNLFEFS